MNQNTQYLTLGELFSGPGGLALGAILSESNNNGKILKIRHGWANDYDPDSCETYKKNICRNTENNSVICEDVRKLNLDLLTPIDIFAYGFPCNDFSIVGKQKGVSGKFGPLYSYGIKIINKFKPKVFVAENVGGIASADNGETFQKILNDLKNAGHGYKIAVHLYKAEDYGVPQTRHRYIIVGIDKTLGMEFKVPKPTHIGNYVTASSALSGIKSNALNHEYTKTASRVVDRLKYIKPGENAWTANLPKHLQLNVRGAKLSQIYKRLSPDQPAYTITGSGGGGTHGYHYNEPRPLTNRERARLQSFPDEFEFLGLKESVRKQIGMAVPPQLSKVIFQAILNTLNKIAYPFINPNYQTESLGKQLASFDYEQNRSTKNNISNAQSYRQGIRNHFEESRIGA